jgi:hypothetical protein
MIAVRAFARRRVLVAGMVVAIRGDLILPTLA